MLTNGYVFIVAAVARQSTNLQGNRRDSTSTISSFYCSMRSSDNSPHPFGSQMSSRRNSEISQLSATRLSTLNSPYDPISPGSSRKSSNVSNFQGISASMTAHLQRLHRRAIENQQDLNSSTANLVVQTQNMSIDNNSNQTTRLPKISNTQGRQTSMSCQTPLPHEIPNKEIRRASDPVRPLDRNFGMQQRLNRHHSYNNFNRSNALAPINKSPPAKPNSHSIRHPNANIVLEELDENEPIETNQNLIIPDDMMQYLNQVAGEHGDGIDDDRPMSEMSIPISSVSQYAEISPKVPTAASTNNHMLSPTYATLQPVRTSKPPNVVGQYPAVNNSQMNCYLNQQVPTNIQPAMTQPSRPQMNQSMAAGVQQQNMASYQMNNNACYNHQNVGCHNTSNMMQNWNVCPPNPGDGYQNMATINGNNNHAGNLMACGGGAANNDYQQPHVCANHSNFAENNMPGMYSNNNNNYVLNQSSHNMCNNCGSGAPTNNTGYTNLMPPPQEHHCNMTANYCMVQQPAQFLGTTLPPNDKASTQQNNFIYNRHAEIQCHDISQSCRPSSNKMRNESYQRTLEYVQQCQQICSDGTTKTVLANQGMAKKPSMRRTSVSIEMSPGCKEVTSTTDNCSAGLVMTNPALALSPGNVLNLPVAANCRSDEHDSCLNTPCIESLKSAAQTPVLPTDDMVMNNMVINNMSSSLATFAEETKYLQMIH